eukprot:CAMPEP_0185362418 /NCGR_PEP_ID=MMETSP1364-20130426/11010_1 /TAXON_ID=38817 /ORGANISM="Gephyrocapsa oceanica, Strain RCC1303" /LENGTH=215 /DNA_ID=CAMNT_0027962805 /DNA_START=57 /DNA_END=705 /DNA_ORIENTATION=+
MPSQATPADGPGNSSALDATSLATSQVAPRYALEREQAIFRHDGRAEAASGLGEASEGEESDESSGDALDCSRGGGGTPALIEMVAVCIAASAQLFDRLGGRSARGGGRDGGRFSTGRRGGGRVPIVRRHGRDQRTGRSAQEVAAARREAHRLHQKREDSGGALNRSEKSRCSSSRPPNGAYGACGACGARGTAYAASGDAASGGASCSIRSVSR